MTLVGMQAHTAERIIEALEAIAANPFAHRANVGRVAGGVDVFRLRTGNWRSVYWIDRENETMVVQWIGQRGQVYRRMRRKKRKRRKRT